MLVTQRIELEGKRYVVVPEDEYENLRQRAEADDLPPLPEPDAKGNFPAIEYARASIARGIIIDRKRAGLTQQALADLAGVRQETLSRLESGKHSASPDTMAKIDA